MSSINANATVTLTVNGKQAEEMLENLKKRSEQLNVAIEKAAKAGNKVELKRLQRELRQTDKQIAQIESATVGVEKVLRNLDKATPKELNKTLSTLKKQLNGIERGTEEWNKQCEAIKRVKNEIDRVNADLRESESRWARFNRVVNDWQTTIMGAAAAVTGLVMAGRSAVNAYAEMDAEMANVRKYTGMTADQVKELNEEFKKMDTRTSREDLNKLAEEAGRLGKTSMEDILGFVRAADQINVALDELGEGATLTLSKLTSIFGDEKKLGTEKALLAVGSVINELSQNCTAAAPYLANFAKRMAGVGAQAKMTIPEIMGFAAVLDSQGQAVEMSATAVSKLIMDMFKQQDKVISATGINAEKFKEALTKSTNEGLLMLLERLHELGNIDVLAPVFKDMGENGARAAQVISALAGNLDMIRWEQEEANKAFKEATSVGKEYNVQNNTVQADLDKARKRVKELAVTLGEQLMPVMRHIYSSTSLILRLLSTVVGFIVRNKTEIIAVTAALSAYAIAINLTAVKAAVATAAHAAWNAVVKVGNMLMPIARVLIDGMKLAYERIVWQTRGATAAQQSYNKSLAALKAASASAKLAVGLLGVAIAALVIAIVRYTKARSEQALVEKNINNIKKEAILKAEEEKTKIENLVAAANNETLSLQERQKAINALNKIIPNYNGQLDATTGKYRANKRALDDYINSLVKMYEVMGAKEKLKEIGAQKADLQIQIAEQQELRRETTERNAQNAADAANHPQTTGGAYMPANVNQAMAGSAEVAGIDAIISGLNRKMSVLNKTEEIIKKLWGKDIQKAEISETSQPKEEDVTPPSVGAASGTSTSNKTGGSSNNKSEERFKAEKEWKAKEEALNRIAYATGKKNYNDYTLDMIKIEQQYHEKILKHTDLTEMEKLEAQAKAAEANKKLLGEINKQSEELEKALYNEQVAELKQRYIDGEINEKTYQEELKLLELEYLRNRINIYEEGSKERIKVEREYQEKLFEDQRQRQKETEEKEKQHQQKLAELKKEFFGDNLEERTGKYFDDLVLLKDVFGLEIKAAGDNAEEKLRIEEAYQKAKVELRKKYNILSESDEKNFLEKWNEDLAEWMESDLGQSVTKSVDTLMSGMSSIFSQLSALVQSETDIQMAALDKKYDAEISKAEGNNYKVRKLEKEKQKEEAKLKNEANKKMFAMQVIQAVAQTATAALNAYSSAAAIPYVGYIIAPIAAAMAIAAGTMQVAAIKKQQQASEAQGYSEGGFTGDGKKDEVAGVVHKGEWVASQRLLQSPVARPMIDALDYAQRTNKIGSLRSDDVSRTIAPVAYSNQSPAVIVQQSATPDAQKEIIATQKMIVEYAVIMRKLIKRLDEPFVTVNTVSGDTGIKQAQDEYSRLIQNKTPKSRRK